MNDTIDTLTHLIVDNIRLLGSIACAVVMLVGFQHLVHHMVVEQAANTAQFEQLTKPLPTGATLAQKPAQQPQWIPVQ